MGRRRVGQIRIADKQHAPEVMSDDRFVMVLIADNRFEQYSPASR